MSYDGHFDTVIGRSLFNMPNINVKHISSSDIDEHPHTFQIIERNPFGDFWQWRQNKFAKQFKVICPSINTLLHLQEDQSCVEINVQNHLQKTQSFEVVGKVSPILLDRGFLTS